MSLRTFTEHRLRPVESLDGLWEFFPECDGAFEGEVPETYTRHIEVPSAWESLPGLQGYRGAAWYRKTFHLVSGSNLRFAFGGVSHTARVFLDGLEIGGHYDAFTPWDLVVADVKAGAHTLVLRVDNRFGEHSALHIPNDYYTYGGITRPVELHRIPDLYLDKLFATPKLGEGGWSLHVRVRLRNTGSSPAQAGLRLSVAGRDVDLLVPATAPGESVELESTLDLHDVVAWDSDNPRLYPLHAQLLCDGEQVDDKIDRVGFREIRVKGAELLLNGKPLRLRGFNRHEDHPMYGCAIPPVAMAQDLALFEDLNCNFLRTCHYPNDARLLDMCDERGIYVWEESHSRQTPFDVPVFEKQIHDSTVEMVENHHNHPCILMWGSLNECITFNELGLATHKRIMNLLRELDGSRPVTYAGHHRTKDQCTGFADIVSWNLYTGWYGGRPEKTGEEFEDLLSWLDSPESKGGAGKPVIISEFGAGAIPGCRNPQGDPWSEEGQVKVLDEALKVYLHHPRIVGTAIWQFCDVRVTRESNPDNGYSPMGRPRCLNNKGVVDEYRRPKLSYAAVKDHMAAAAREQV